MMEHLAVLWIYLFSPENALMSVFLIASLVVLFMSLYRMRIKNRRKTAFSVFLFALTIILYNGTILLRQATMEVSVTNYHKLLDKTSRSRQFNDHVFVFLNKHRNRLTGYDYARLNYEWSKLTPEQQNDNAE